MMILVLFFLLFAKAEVDLFIQNFGSDLIGTNTTTGKAVIALVDGSYILAGTTKGLSPLGSTDLLITKIDKYGKITWTKAHGFSNILDEIDISGAIENTKGIYIVGTKRNMSAYSLLFMHLNSDGSKNFTRHYYLDDSNVYGFDITKDISGNLLVSGKAQISGKYNGIIMKFNSDGVLLLQKSFGNSTQDDGFNGIYSLSSGNGYVTIGSVMKSGKHALIVSKFHNLDLGRNYSLILGDYSKDIIGYDILELPESGDYIICGTYEGKPFISRINDSLVTPWNIEWGYSFGYHIGALQNIIRLSNGDILAVSDNGFLFLFSDNGIVRWIKELSSYTNHKFYDLSISTDRQTIVIGGSSNSNSKMWIGKLSVNASSCGFQPNTSISLSSISFGYVLNNASISSSPIISLKDQSVDVTERSGISIVGHYECTECSKNYISSMCNITTCFGKLSNSSAACSGAQGTCEGFDKCKCSNNYFGKYCNITKCFGELSNSSSACNEDKGTCVDYNKCKCANNYFGKYCNITTCFDQFSNISIACNGAQGTCYEYNKCKCSDNYFGINCNITNCFGKLNNETGTCSNNGNCVLTNKCSCKKNYYGKYCNITTCFGQFSNDSISCNYGQGTCEDYNKCKCSNNYFGIKCNITSCFGKLNNETETCSNNGNCVLTNKCSCKKNYYGKYCNVTTCFDQFSNTSSACNGAQGTCIDYNKCKCSNDYFGVLCNITNCFGKLNNVSGNCWNHGNCVLQNICECSSNYFGKFCNISKCFDVLSNMSSSCGIHGTCEDLNMCKCKADYYGKYCNITTCNGLFSNTSETCGLYGICKSHDTCGCIKNYYGKYCNITSCGGIFTNSSVSVLSTICSKRGKCVNYNNCSCNINSTLFDGSNCDTPVCNGKVEDSCGGHGNCSNSQKCKCDKTYFGNSCVEKAGSTTATIENSRSKINIPFEFPVADPAIVSKLGKIVEDKEIFVCSSRIPNIVDVVGKDVTCRYVVIDPKNASSYHGIKTNELNFEAVEAVNDKICKFLVIELHDPKNTNLNTHGKTFELKIKSITNSEEQITFSLVGMCQESGHYGADCDVYICNNIFSNSSSVCNEHGKCTSPGNCECDKDYEGTYCKDKIEPGLSETTIIVLSSVLGTFGFCVIVVCMCMFVVLLYSLCCVFCCIGFYTIFTTICGTRVTLDAASKSGKFERFGEVEEVDKELEENADTEVNMDDVNLEEKKNEDNIEMNTNTNTNTNDFEKNDNELDDIDGFGEPMVDIEIPDDKHNEETDNVTSASSSSD